MLHKTFATIETETEAAGSFTALVSTYTVDRQGERVVPGAFTASLERWRKSGHMIPVVSDHVGEVKAVIGRVDPRLTSESDQGLEAVGVLDMATELGRRVYELVKQGTLSWSIGFVIPTGGRRKVGEITELTEVDLAEISAVPVPANRDVRTLSIKGLAERPEADFTLPSDGEIRERARQLDVEEKARRPIQIRTFEC